MIQIGFSTTNSILSRTVRWFTHSKASHAFLLFDWLGQKWVLEAGAFGVVILPWEKVRAQNIITNLFDTDLTDQDLEWVLSEHLGDSYDYGALLGGIFVGLGRWIKKKISNPWNNPKAMFCSELITELIKHKGTPGSEALVPADTNPENLIEFLER